MFSALNILGTPPTKIALQTLEARDVANEQALAADIDRPKHALLSARQGWHERRAPYGYCNCAGFVWANGRTAILDDPMWDKILKEDRYQRIGPDEVELGDLVVYRDPKRGFLHVAQVFSTNQVGNARVSKVLSKFPSCGEFTHPALGLAFPGFDLQIEYFRLARP